MQVSFGDGSCSIKGVHKTFDADSDSAKLVQTSFGTQSGSSLDLIAGKNYDKHSGRVSLVKKEIRDKQRDSGNGPEV